MGLNIQIPSESTEYIVPRAKKAAKTFTLLPNLHVMDLLETISQGKVLLKLKKGEKLFSQGDRADAIFFLQSGKVKITVISAAGKEAVIAMMGPHHFLGEGALVGQSLRISTATILEPSTVYRVEKRAMTRALHDQADLSEQFIAALLVRNIDLEEDLCDQLFNHSEKRLARVLLKLARLRDNDVSQDAKIPLLSHETLAEMVGTTRARVTHFMNKFRTMGLIDYNGELTVRTEMLTDVVLHD
jgi:CRP/FNR family transcriptional regulator, cyclic AMP receptor protein